MVGVGFEPLHRVHGVREIVRLVCIVDLGVGEETLGQDHILDDYLRQVKVEQISLHSHQNLGALKHLLTHYQLCLLLNCLPHHRLLLECLQVKLAIK